MFTMPRPNFTPTACKHSMARKLGATVKTAWMHTTQTARASKSWNSLLKKNLAVMPIAPNIQSRNSNLLEWRLPGRGYLIVTLVTSVFPQSMNKWMRKELHAAQADNFYRLTRSNTPIGGLFPGGRPAA